MYFKLTVWWFHMLLEESQYHPQALQNKKYIVLETNTSDTLVWPNLYWVWSISIDPSSFSQAFLLSMNCPSGIALAFSTLYLCLKSAYRTLLGNPFLQILIPSSTPLHLSWCRTSSCSMAPSNSEYKWVLYSVAQQRRDTEGCLWMWLWYFPHSAKSFGKRSHHWENWRCGSPAERKQMHLSQQSSLSTWQIYCCSDVKPARLTPCLVS